jgi:hypothetical protein
MNAPSSCIEPLLTTLRRARSRSSAVLSCLPAEQPAQHEREDTAVPVVLDLHVGVEPGDRLELPYSFPAITMSGTPAIW